MGYYAAGGYYRAGGFGSFFKKATRFVSKVVSNPLTQTALGMVPGGSTALGAMKAFNVFRSQGGASAPAVDAAYAGSMPGHPVTLSRTRRPRRVRWSRRRR